MNTTLYQETPFRLFVKYAVPQTVGLMLNSVYLIVDGMFIGNRLGREAMAAAAVAVPVVEILIALALAVSVGACVIISNSFGAGNAEKANAAFNLSLFIAAGASALIALAGNLFLEETAVLLGATPEILPDAMIYLRYLVSASPFLIFSFAFSSYARADNRPKLAMWALGIGSVSNILLDYVFMYPLNMGIAGAALATALGPVFSVVILLPHFVRGQGQLRFSLPALSAESLRIVRAILILGAPAFVMEFSIGMVTLFYNIAINRNGFGEIGLAAYLTIGYIALIVLTVFLGVGQGIQPIVSYFHGRGDMARAREFMVFLFKAIAGVGIGMSVAIAFFSRGFIAVFTPGDAELIDFTHGRATLYFIGFVFAGISILIITYFQSIQKAAPAFVLALLRSVVFAALFLFVFPMIWGPESIWPALSAAEAAACIAGVWFYAISARRQ